VTVFEAGAIAFRLQMLGQEVFKQDAADAEQGFQKIGASADGSAPKVAKAGGALDDTGKKGKAASSSLDEATKATTGLGESAAKTAPKVKAGSDAVEATAAAAKKAKAPLDDTAKSTKTVGDESDKATPKVKQTKEEIAALSAKANAARTEVGTAFLGIGAAITVVTGAAIARFADFDAGMSNVIATTQANAAQQKQLADVAVEAGARTTFSAREAADAEDELAKAGLSVHDIITGGLAGSLALAAAGQLGVARAGEIAATTLQQFNLEGDQAGRVADVLAAGAGKAIGSVDDLANGLKFVGPVAHSMNIGLEETVGTLSLFAKAGIVGEQGGTAFRGMLSSLTSPSAQASAEIKRLRIELYDGQGNFLGMENAAGELRKAYSALTPEARDASLGILFGNEQVTAARVLYQEGAEGVREMTKAVNDSGYAAEQAAKKQDNLSGDVEKLGGSIDSTFIKTGSGANEVLRDLVQISTAVADAIGKVPAPVLGVGLALGVGVAAVLLLGGTVLTVIPKLIAFNAALEGTGLTLRGLALAGGPILIALTAVTTVLGMLAASSAESEQNVDALKESLDQVTGATTDYTRELVKNELESSGAFKQARELGISLKDVTDAALGSEAAQKRVNERLEEYRDGLGQGKSAVLEYGNNTRDLTGAIGGQNDAIDQAKDKLRDSIEANGDNAASVDDSTRAHKEIDGELTDVTQSLEGLVKSLKDANGDQIDAKEAQISYLDALAATGEALAKNGATLDLSSEKGRDNNKVLLDQAKAAQDAADAAYAVDHNYGAYQATLEGSRDALIQNYLLFDNNADRARAFADQVLRIPTKAEVDVSTNAELATAKMDALARSIKSVQDRVNAGVNIYTSPGGAKLYEADGGKVYAFARGGNYENHSAQFSRAGDVRIWSEPETGGEYYIPMAQSKRSRSVQIAAQMAGEMGYMLVPSDSTAYADGGSSTGRKSFKASERAIQVTQNIYPSQGMDEDALADKAIKKLTERL